MATEIRIYADDAGKYQVPPELKGEVTYCREMYCRVMSFIETVKRRGLNIYQSIIALMEGEPVIQ